MFSISVRANMYSFAQIKRKVVVTQGSRKPGTYRFGRMAENGREVNGNYIDFESLNWEGNQILISYNMPTNNSPGEKIVQTLPTGPVSCIDQFFAIN